LYSVLSAFCHWYLLILLYFLAFCPFFVILTFIRYCSFFSLPSDFRFFVFSFCSYFITSYYRVLCSVHPYRYGTPLDMCTLRAPCGTVLPVWYLKICSHKKYGHITSSLSHILCLIVLKHLLFCADYNTFYRLNLHMNYSYTILYIFIIYTENFYSFSKATYLHKIWIYNSRKHYYNSFVQASLCIEFACSW